MTLPLRTVSVVLPRGTYARRLRLNAGLLGLVRRFSSIGHLWENSRNDASFHKNGSLVLEATPASRRVALRSTKRAVETMWRRPIHAMGVFRQGGGVTRSARLRRGLELRRGGDLSARFVRRSGLS